MKKKMEIKETFEQIIKEILELDVKNVYETSMKLKCIDIIAKHLEITEEQYNKQVYEDFQKSTQKG